MYKKQIISTFAVCILLICSVVVAQQQKKPLTNADVVTMIKAGLAESTIILTIKQATPNFDTSPEALIQLKNQGASPKILDAILQAQSESKPALSPMNPPKNDSKLNVREFVFEVDSCKRASGGLICQLTVSNESSEDRNITIVGTSSYEGLRSRIFDEFGNEYLADETSFGSKTLRDCTERGGCFATMEQTLIPHTPMRVKLTFDAINSDAKMIKVLRVIFYWEEPNKGRVNIYADLKNIPIKS